MTEQLYNKKSKDDLIGDLNSEDFNRLTLSFYKYIEIDASFVGPPPFIDSFNRDVAMISGQIH